MLKFIYLRTASPIELPEDARLRPLCRCWRSIARWSPCFSFWNVFGPARHGEGRRVGGSDCCLRSAFLAVWAGAGLRSGFSVCVDITVGDSGVHAGDAGIFRSGDASAASCQPSKKAPSSVASRAAAFSAAGVFGEVRRVCCLPMLMPMADCTVSSSKALSSGVSSSDGVRSPSMIEANWISARAFWRRDWLLAALGAGSAMSLLVVDVCVGCNHDQRAESSRHACGTLLMSLCGSVSYPPTAEGKGHYRPQAWRRGLSRLLPSL